MDLQKIVLELYGLPLDEFVSARDAHAAEARKQKARQLANELKGLAKPTVGAWAVNQLVRRRGPLVERLLRIGDGLREAQLRLDGERLRELSAERRRVTAEVTGALRELGVSDAAEQEALDTLAAAVAEESAAAEVRAGAVTRVLRHSGFGGLQGMLAASAATPEWEAAKPECEAAESEPATALQSEAVLRVEHKLEVAPPDSPETQAKVEAVPDLEPPSEENPGRQSEPEAGPDSVKPSRVPEKLLRRRLERVLEAVEEAQVDRDSARERVDSLRERLQAARDKLKAAEEALRAAEAERDELQEELDELE